MSQDSPSRFQSSTTIVTNRREYHKAGRHSHVRDRYVRLPEFMLASPAFCSLDGNSVLLYIHLARRYRGPNSNNGKIPFSVREAAAMLHIGRGTAQRCFERLQVCGFIKVGKRSGFDMKGRVSTEWVLTEFSDDTLSVTTPPTKDFMRWTAQNLNNSPTTEPVCPAGEPPMALEWDADA